MVIAAPDTNLIVTPDKQLIGWGSNITKLVGNGSIPYYPYIARKMLLKDVEVVKSNEWNCAMAVDKNGVLWGWGKNTVLTLFDENGPVSGVSRPSKPIQIMDNTLDVDIGDSHVIVLKKDGSVWTWGDARWGSLGVGPINHNEWFMPPQKILDNGKKVFAFHKLCFAIDANNDLYVWGNQTSQSTEKMQILCSPQKIASNIEDVSMQSWKQYLLLTTNGTVRLLDITEAEQTRQYSASMISDVIAENVVALYKSTLKKSNGTYWLFDSSKQNNGQIQQIDRIVYYDFEILENGHIVADGLWPFKSFRLLSTSYRNAVLISLLVILITKHFTRK